MRDIIHSMAVRRAISPVSEAGNTPLVSQIIDMQGYASLAFLIATGSLGDAGAEFTTLVEDSDDSAMGGAVPVADAELNGTEAGASFIQSADDSVFKIGYVGAKRYVRLTITPANNGTAALISAVAVLAHGAAEPIAQ